MITLVPSGQSMNLLWCKKQKSQQKLYCKQSCWKNTFRGEISSPAFVGLLWLLFFIRVWTFSEQLLELVEKQGEQVQEKGDGNLFRPSIEILTYSEVFQ